MSNFEEILGRGYSELPPSMPLPDGKWLLKGRFAAAFEFESKDGDKGARISFTDAAVKPVADVDEDQLAELGDDGWNGKQVETTFFVTNKEDERKVWDYLVKRGIDGDEYESMESALKAVRDTTVIGTVRTRTFETKDGEEGFRNFTVKTEAVSL